MDINSDKKHRLVEGGPRDLVTILLVRSRAFLSAYNKHGDKR